MSGRATSSEEMEALEAGLAGDPSGVSARPRESQPQRSSAPDPFDDVTPPKAVSIFDLDEELPTRLQSSEEIEQFQKLAREKRGAAAMRTFAPPRDDAPRAHSSSGRPKGAPQSQEPGSPSDRAAASSGSHLEPGASPSHRPVPRESGPIRIDRPRTPKPDAHLELLLEDVAKGLERLPAAPRVPEIEQPRNSLERIPRLSDPTEIAPAPARRPWVAALGTAVFVVAVLAAVLAYRYFV